MPSLQLISNGLLLAIGNLVGLYYQYMTMAGRQRTVERTRSCVESRVRLECEKEHQEQLLLSVIPAYIAAEVSEQREREGVAHQECIFWRMQENYTKSSNVKNKQSF